MSYLDTADVKRKCRLSYSFANEERRKGPARREHIDLRVDSYADYKQFWVSAKYKTWAGSVITLVNFISLLKGAGNLVSFFVHTVVCIR